jgi:hypothetical protein
MDFKTATDRLTTCVGHAEIADAAGVSVQSVRQARLDPNNPNYRPAPSGWQRALARIAKQRSKELKALAEELERD